MPILDLPMKIFEYPVRVHPHHTDYAGIVWHGTYVTWMEAARVEYLRSHGLNFADWVASGVDLPVVDLTLRYRQSLLMGMDAVVKAWLEPRRGVRLVWQYDIQNASHGRELCVRHHHPGPGGSPNPTGPAAAASPVSGRFGPSLWGVRE
jgi:acyl-CoA thioester hydrolase